MVFTSFWDYLQSLGFWPVFSIGLGVASIVIIILYFVIFSRYRSKKLKSHQIKIDLNGGIFQGSSEELIIKAKLGAEVDLGRIRPVKEGYRFNGFNVYKQYISSTIKEDGLVKSSVTKEELDGVDKSIVVMPSYDLVFIAQYSPLSTTPVIGLSTDEYYPDFLSFDDLIADLKHLNNDKATWPVEIKFRRSLKIPNMVFVFKGDTICAMLNHYKSISKVFFRTSDSTDGKLLTPFYQTEDINDAMNWYSMVVIYSTKPSRFINTFKEVYDGIDETIPTSEIEFNLIVSSLSNLADPILDRAILIVERFEKDKLLTPVPEYVLKRELPPDLDENGEPRKQVQIAVSEEQNEQAEEIPAEEPEPEPIKEEPKEEPKQEEPIKEAEPVEEVKPAPIIQEVRKPVIEPVPLEKAPRPIIKPVEPLKKEPVQPAPAPEEEKPIIKPIEINKVSSVPSKRIIRPVDPRLVHITPLHTLPSKEKKASTAKALDFQPKKTRIPKPVGLVDIRHVKSDSEGQLSKSTPTDNSTKVVSSISSPKPDFVTEEPVKKTKRRKKRVSSTPKKVKAKPVVKKPEVQAMPIISGERRIPHSSKPRKRNVPTSRQIPKIKKKPLR